MASQLALAGGAGVALGAAFAYLALRRPREAAAPPAPSQPAPEAAAAAAATPEPAPLAPQLDGHALARELQLIAHPEGGYFLETYRAGATPMTSKGKTDESGALMPCRGREGGERNVLTSIYYMLTDDSPKQWWANNMSDHVHYWHGGGELTYHVVEPNGTLSAHTLGPKCPQLVVRGGSFKCVQLAAGAKYGLLGEAVAPGFDFRDFKFVKAAELRKLLPAAQFEKLKGFLKEAPESTFDSYYDKPRGA